MLVHVRTEIDRVAPELVEQFKKHATATIHEASGRKGYIDYKIKPIAGGMKVCGPAFTVQCPPGDNMMLHKALEKARPGDVIVAIVGGAEDYGYFGDLMATSAIARGVGGLCIEGCIRDSADIIAAGFPVFSKGFCIRGTAKGTLGLVNYPAVFGGIMVNPGDLIAGDDDGLVLVRREDAADVLKKTEERVAKETDKAKVLASGVSSVEFNKFGPLFEAAGLAEE
ncbi:MAG: 4-carboxy-4-hydroxy-2-oxoadipate aldolase/oxaloacetate decarboxylase [Treponema sp.]|jgi:4-hydroxy-4-methyl-2-oxoglutarate aldolase|nr:4-carboxy-4-hydroxy-2-oxoadipate aldolase/oxaloacetate decarboxylase [Treponema sp.]